MDVSKRIGIVANFLTAKPVDLDLHYAAVPALRVKV
jgi:hypothetical protein